jgi:hypothetical protein
VRRARSPTAGAIREDGVADDGDEQDNRGAKHRAAVFAESMAAHVVQVARPSLIPPEKIIAAESL